MSRDKLTLLPTPRQVEWRNGNYKLTTKKRIALLGAPAQALRFSAQRLCDALRQRKIDWTIAATATGDDIGAKVLGDSRIALRVGKNCARNTNRNRKTEVIRLRLFPVNFTRCHSVQ
jgi:hypothetical protein